LIIEKLSILRRGLTIRVTPSESPPSINALAVPDLLPGIVIVPHNLSVLFTKYFITPPDVSMQNKILLIKKTSDFFEANLSDWIK
jgi:hypothetical protein